MPQLPTGTVTLLFTDIEGSTRLLRELGEDAYRDALAEHRRIVRAAFAQYQGYEVDYEGDAFFYAFASATDAVSAVEEAMRKLEPGPIRIRVGVHTGQPGLDPPKYVGVDVHLAARIMSAGHGGQVLLSRSTRELVDAPVRDLGEYRLKDFEEPVALFQLGDGDFAPLKTVSNTNLPRPVSSFVGRERERSDVTALLREHRLVTLLGPGGTGKTRLAIEAATELVGAFKAGVFWIDLAPLHDPALVVETVAQTLGATDELSEHIGEREMLLLLDNFEQVVDAAADVAQLITACPNLRVLVTSRTLLRVRGEVEYQVLPLAEVDAVTLFTERTRLPRDRAIEELCRRLDRMPLALELAAARARVLTVEQIMERLSQRLDLFRGGRDVDARQRTLRATIEWSYDLLNEPERDLYARLGVFASGCTLEAAEAVCDADLDTLESLVENSLVRWEEGRFRMFETIREHAAERLSHAPDADAIRTRFADYFTAFGAERENLLRAADAGATLEVDAELDNIREVLEWTGTSDKPLYLSSLVSSLWFFWATRGHVREGIRWARELVRDGEVLPPEELQRALQVAGELLKVAGEREEAARMKGDAVMILRTLSGQEQELAIALADLSGIKAELGELESARAAAVESVELAGRHGSRQVRARSLWAMGDVEFQSGDFERARERFGEIFQLDDRGPDRAGAELMIGKSARRLGDLGDARRRFRAALALGSEHQQVALLPEIFEEVGALVLEHGDAERAATLFGAAERLLAEVGFARVDPSGYEVQLDVLRASLAEPERQEAWDRGAAMSSDEAVRYAEAFLNGVPEPAADS